MIPLSAVEAADVPQTDFLKIPRIPCNGTRPPPWIYSNLLGLLAHSTDGGEREYCSDCWRTPRMGEKGSIARIAGALHGYGGETVCGCVGVVCTRNPFSSPLSPTVIL